MRVALITYHYSTNSGAIMQTYALCRYLKELGHDVIIIDLRQDESKYLKPFLKKVFFKMRTRHIIHKYYPELTRRYYNLNDLQADPPKVDCYMVGSDQVWNPSISKNLLYAYYLDFGKDDIIRISYASSFGVSEWPLEDENVNLHIKYLLSRFKAVSVREEQGQQICKERFSCNSKLVLDPTFLNYRYDEFWKDGKDVGGLLCYKLNKNKDFWDNILSVGEKIGMEVMVLNNSLPRKGFKYCPPTSLETWMQKFHDASFIVTDSFHGVAFSIINRKQFVVILNNNKLNSRLVNLMHQMGLDDRVYSSVAEMNDRTDWLNPIEYSRIEGRIETLVENSRKFLADALTL